MIVEFTTYIVHQKATYETRRFGFDKTDSEAKEWIEKTLTSYEKSIKLNSWNYIYRDKYSITYGIKGYCQTRIEYRIR